LQRNTLKLHENLKYNFKITSKKIEMEELEEYKRRQIFVDSESVPTVKEYFYKQKGI